MQDQSHLIKWNSQRVSKHLLHQEFSFSQLSKCHEHFLSPCYVPRTPEGAGVAPLNHTQSLLLKNNMQAVRHESVQSKSCLLHHPETSRVVVRRSISGGGPLRNLYQGISCTWNVAAASGQGQPPLFSSAEKFVRKSWH